MLRQHEATEQCMGSVHCPFATSISYSMNMVDNSMGMVIFLFLIFFLNVVLRVRISNAWTFCFSCLVSFRCQPAVEAEAEAEAEAAARVERRRVRVKVAKKRSPKWSPPYRTRRRFYLRTKRTLRTMRVRRRR